MPKKKRVKRPGHRRRQKVSVAMIERGLKTRILSLLMLVLASSLGLWFTNFQPLSVLAWLLTAFIGGYIIFESRLFVSKALVVLSALVMEFFVLSGVPNLLTWGSPANLMLVAFAFLDLVLIYALSKL